MTAPAPIPAEFFGDPDPDGFRSACLAANTVVHFVLNVGDGDLQLILLPGKDGEARRALVVDVAITGKLPPLVDALRERGLLRGPTAGPTATPALDRTFPVVVGTHPHDDHIGGMPDFLERFADQIAEYWEPGYFHTTPAYQHVAQFLEDHQGSVVLTQPASGMTRFVDGVRITVLAPGVSLKNRYDTYGIDLNNASVSLKLEFPTRRVEQRDDQRLLKKIPRVRSIILGADAQTLSWGQVLVDFPALEGSQSAIDKAMRMARGTEPLRSEVFKVSHHASKRGINLELIEQLQPTWCLVSSTGGDGRYQFPHAMAQLSLREARQKRALTGEAYDPDYQLGIFYTCDLRETTTGRRGPRHDPLGSMALVIPSSGPIHLWRFGDAIDVPLDLDAASPYTGPEPPP